MRSLIRSAAVSGVFLSWSQTYAARRGIRALAVRPLVELDLPQRCVQAGGSSALPERTFQGFCGLA